MARIKRKKKFPKISRAITKSKKYHRRIKKSHRVVLIAFLSVVILLAIFLVELDTFRNAQILSAQKEKRENLERQKKFWIQVLDKYPDYRDGYFALALIYYELEDLGIARENLDAAYKIDPNFEKGREFEEKYLK